MRVLIVIALLVAATRPCAAQAPPESDAARSRDAERRQAMPAPPPSATISIDGSVRGGVQWIAEPRPRDDVFGFGALDVVVTARPAPEVTLLVDVETAGGTTPDDVLGSLSRFNTETERLEGRDTKVILREAWVRVQLLDGRVRFNVGKLDAGHYFDRNFFAEDETRQFLNAALTVNPLLQPPPNGPAATLRVSLNDWRYAAGVHAPDAIDGDLSGLPYVIGEIGRRNVVALRGHYRWWARVGSVPDRREDVTWATGISVDQIVAAETGVFLRTALSRSDGETLTSHSVSGGVQHTPSWIGRSRDLVGAGISYQREPAGHERVAEIYYNVSLASCCSIIANVEWLASGPNHITGRRNRDAVVPGLRAVILF